MSPTRIDSFISKWNRCSEFTVRSSSGSRRSRFTKNWKKNDLINPAWRKFQWVLLTQHLLCQKSPLVLIVKWDAIEIILYTFMSGVYETSYLESILLWINNQWIADLVWQFVKHYKYAWNILKFLLRMTFFFKGVLRSCVHCIHDIRRDKQFDVLLVFSGFPLD